MERLGPGGSELPLEEKVDRIASAGFKGAEVEAMTGPDGREMSDRWEEAVQLKGLIELVWERLEVES